MIVDHHFTNWFFRIEV